MASQTLVAASVYRELWRILGMVDSGSVTVLALDNAMPGLIDGLDLVWMTVFTVIL
jgi:hypothetical protein